jgi:L-amino acid N-acyltransferase YncA
MLIRDADAARDAAACATIYAPSVTDGVASLEEVAPDAAELGRRIATVTARYPWIVAELDGEVVGYAYAGPHRERASYRWSTDVTVYVSAAHHRRGVGRALYMRLFALLAQQGYYEACAGITLPNDASVALHESLGFGPVGVYRNIAFKFGAWRDVGWWQKTLRQPVPPGAPPAEPGAPPSAHLHPEVADPDPAR